MRRRDAAEAPTAIVDIRRLVLGAVVLPPVLMAIVAGWLAWQIGRLMDAARWVDHTGRVVAQANEQAEHETVITAVGAAALLLALGVALSLLALRQLRVVAATYREALARVASSEAALGRLVDQERDAREKAQEAARMKDEFLSTLSHELRTPLTAILGWAAVLRSRSRGAAGSGAPLTPLPPPSADVTTRALAAIERNARTQAQLVDDLLDVSRIVSGKLRLDLQRMDLAAAVRAAMDVVRFSAESKGVRVDVAIEPAALSMTGDAQRLQQVAWNLMSNAIKFTPRGGRVEVRLARVEEGAQIVVRDSGEGISPEFLPHVFERFRQGDASMKRAHGGLGLGLAIVKLIVEMHGGDVRAESAGPGLGATFTVTLPITERPARAPEPAASAALAAPSSLAAPLAGVRVLVIDDEPDALEVISMILSAHGAEVTPAASGSDALGILERAEVDVIVSDIGMPELDGYELLERIRRKRSLPAVALTAYARAEDAERARAAGFQRHLPKPVSPAQLVETVTGLAREA